MASESLFSVDGVLCRLVHGFYADTRSDACGCGNGGLAALQFTAFRFTRLDNESSNNAGDFLFRIRTGRIFTR